LVKLSINNHIVGLLIVHKKHIMRTCLMYHAACKVEFQPFKRSYSQLTFFNLKKKSQLLRMTMETRCFKVIFPKYSKKRNRLKIRSYRRYGEHGEKMFVFLGLFVHAAVRGGTCAFTLKIVNTLIKNSSRDDRPSIST